MRLPRLSIGGLMLAVAIIALDGAALVAILGRRCVDDGFSWLLPAVVALVGLLVFQVVGRLPRLGRTGRADFSFAVGFQVGAWGTLGGLMAVGLAAPDLLTRYGEAVYKVACEPLEPYIRDAGRITNAFEVGALLAIFGGPAAVAGLLGGWLARRLGLVVEVRIGHAGRRDPAVEPSVVP